MLYVYLFVYLGVSVCAKSWRWEEDLQELVCFFHHVGSKDPV